MAKCWRCDGSGTEECGECGGAGTTTISADEHDHSEDITGVSLSCPKCHGSGEGPCRECGGEGDDGEDDEEPA